jgi:hypothetical protein
MLPAGVELLPDRTLLFASLFNYQSQKANSKLGNTLALAQEGMVVRLR